MKLLLLAAVVAAVAAKDTYVVVAPSQVRPGMQYSVSVNILQATGNVDVTASVIRSGDNQQYSTNSATLTQGAPQTIDLQIPIDLPAGSYELHVAGSGGLTFDNKTQLDFSSKAMSILVQTDKAVYKPGQTVNFRVLAVYPADLSVYKGSMNIDLFDANSNKIKQWLGVPADEGVITQAFLLSNQPVLGDWMIKVTAQNNTQEKVFTVEEYVLPKFEVTVELPSYILEAAPGVPVTVKAKYTYGKPVAGSVVVEGKLDQMYYYSDQRTIQRTAQLDKDGTAVVTFSRSELHSLSKWLAYNTLKFSANVTETLTGAVLGSSGTVTVYTYDYKLEFLTSNPQTFKPGLNYVAFLKLSQPNDLPLGNTSTMVTIKTTATVELSESGSTPYEYVQSCTTTYTLPEFNLSIPVNGLVPLQLSMLANATRISLEAVFQEVTAYTTVEKSYSPSNNYIQLFLRSSDQLQAGGQVSFEIKATEAVNTFVYQVLSRGSIVATGTIMAGGSTSVNFSIPLQASMAPNARFLVYYTRADGEIIADSISFDVSGVFKNQVSVSMNTTQAEPAEGVEVRVSATPYSTVYFLAVDQSVLHLKSGNDITQEQVVEELKSYDSTYFGGGDGIMPFARAGRERRSIWWPYPVINDGSDANETFQNAGVVVLTDALVYQHVQSYNKHRPAMGGFARNMFESDSPSSDSQPLKEVERVRTLFPETWLWSNATVSADGTATVSTTVPDTITSWITSAFAVSSETGLGVAPSTSKLTVFRPFFISLILPYSVVRGEQVVVQAIVFNYMDTDQDVRVSLAQSEDFAYIVLGANCSEQYVHQQTVINVSVPKGEGKSVFFPIVPTIMGNVELMVSAQSTQAADAVRQQLLVKVEGVPKEFGVSVLVDLSHNNSFSKTVNITLPPNIVANSTRAHVTAIGDLMGPTVNGLDNLLSLPTGCGEQTMLSLAPDVFVTAYLSATNQLTGQVKDKAIGFMEKGYETELTYKHKNGSFSAFGEQDESGSMWLTAFVVKTFHQAKPYIFIDDQVINRALSWMVGYQQSDGSFPEPGLVVHKSMQGGAGSGTALTAYVLICLLENSDIQGELSSQVQEAKDKALMYLKQQLPTITDVYVLAITTYALTLAQDSTADGALQRLNSYAIIKDGFRYWHKEVPQTSTNDRLIWGNPQAASLDVEMSSYVLLTYAVKKDIVNGLDVLKWVASQRNPRGGYSSTQDTILALQALSEFARQVYSNNFNIQLDVYAGSFHQQFNITQINALVLQSVELPSIPNSATVTGSGSGIALVEFGVFFNVKAEVEVPRFEINVTLLKDTMNMIEVQACSRWTAEGASGMAVMEVGIPTGFEVDLTTIKKPKVLKRTEVEDRKVVLYFDEVGSIPVCTVLTAQRVKMVSKSQPVAVRIYDYYEPNNQATTFYQSAVLKDSNVCDVCPECGSPGSNNIR